MITTVTLNPMLDKTIPIDALRRGVITRAASLEAVVGGKGINVSRQLKMLGEETVATGFVGGEVGFQLERMLEAEGISHEFVRVLGMTREGVTYREPDGTSTSIFEPPHRVTADEAERLIGKCSLLTSSNSWVVCSGSSPCTESDGVFRAIVASCRARGIPVVLDSYGEAFRDAIDAVPTLVKPNRHECEQTFGRTLAGEDDLIAAARDLVGRGIRYVIISDGAQPCIAATADAVWAAVPPQITAVNATGSGDTMVAGLLHGLMQGWPFADCLAFGVAAGAANASMWSVSSAPRSDILALLPRVTVRKI